ncbi:GNAT family N-acetyltransferase [Ancylobacter terrae]|uniref:GNAT family N-acetyltransferase n=1 Tax=Ancylobacter sp. sgz301288 TaxID=3342077 RepID=UPI00385C9649
MIPTHSATQTPSFLRIRRANPSDLPEIRRLQAAALRGFARRVHGSEVVESLIPRIGDFDVELVSDGTFFLAEIEGEAVACGGWSVREPSFMGSEIELPTTGGVDVPHLHGVFVHPLFIGNGIGSILLEKIDSDLRGQGFARARIAATLSAEGFFAHRGWRRQGAVFGALEGGLIFVGMGMEKRFASELRLAA